MKRLFTIYLFIVLMALPCLGAFSTSMDNRKTYKNAYRWTGKPKDFILDWAQEVEGSLDGSVAIAFTYYDPTDTEPAANEGSIYYDLSEHKLKFRNAGSWVAIEAGSSGNSLDGAYNAGSSITVDANPVLLTTDTGSGIIALSINHGGSSNNSDAIAIAMAGSGDGLQITNEDADSVAMRLKSAASQTVSLAVFDGSSGNWIGANDIGMVHLNKDTALTNAGSSMLYLTNSAQPISSAEGFLARFVSTGTARTDASAVEIEVPTSQPALALNGILSITGQNSPLAVLVQITGNDSSGNTDTMTINSEGTGDGLQITCDDDDSVALHLIAATSQTTSLVKVDGATGSYLGAQNVGMIHVTSDGALAHVDSSLLYIANSGVPQDDARGTSLRIVDTGNASAGTAGYSVYIKTDDATMEAMYIDEGNVLVDEEIVAGVGVQSTATARTATTGGASTGLIARNTRHVTISSDSAIKQITLPAPIVGMKITLVTPATACELIATGSSVKINDVICSATNEAALLADSHYEVTCISSTEWILVSYDKLGAHVAAIVPDPL